jgi:Cu/Ag efflux protein CusF
MKRMAFMLLASLAAALPAHADEAHLAPAASAPAGAWLSEGEVRKVDKDAHKITIRHGALANLDMPAMTMVFRVKDPAMLDKVKAGDKVKFQAEKIDGNLTVMRIERE